MVGIPKPDICLGKVCSGHVETPMKIIGVAGKKRSGKDTLFEVLHSFDKHVYRRAFADALKEEVASILGVSVAFMEEHKDQFRLGLQWYGTDFRRKMPVIGYDDYWLRAMDKWIHRFERQLCQTKDSAVLVIPDVRFPNEVDYIHAKGGLVVKIERPSLVSTDSHLSENALNDYDFDHTIRNDGDLADYRHRILGWFSTLTREWVSPPDACNP